MTNFPPPAQPTLGPPKVPLSTAGKVALVGAAMALVGSFMSWVSVVSIFGSIEMKGFDGDGKLTAAAAVFSILFGYFGLVAAEKSTVVFGTLAGAGGLVVSVYAWNNLQNLADGASSGAAHATVGNGLYLCVGGFVVYLCGLWSAMPRRASAWQVALKV